MESELDGIDKDTKVVILSGREHTQPGSVISNCIFLFGSLEGDCARCTKPCLHPLATDDLQDYFNVRNSLFTITL